MSYTIDTNLLLYASDRESKYFGHALATLKEHGQGPEILYIFWPVIMAYLRISTHSSIFKNPLSPAQAQSNISSLIERSHVRTPGEGERFWPVYQKMTDEMVVRGNLVPDAHIVALMRLYEVPAILSHDRDFHLFDGIKVIDPFALS